MSSPSESEDSLLDVMPGTEAEFARRVRAGGLGSFVNFAVQNRSRSARGVLVRAASDGVLGLTELDFLMHSLATEPCADRSLTLGVIANLNPKPLLALAGLIANQRLGSNDIRDALTLYSLALEAHGRKVFGRVDRKLFLELLSDEGRHEEFDATFSCIALGDDDWRQAMLMLANMANPWVPGNQQGDLASWGRFTASIFNADGVEPLDVAPTVGVAFDNLLCSSPVDAGWGPKVSVLMPTHNPGPRLGTALASLLGQTWRNFEILILDDGSDPEHRFYMDAWAERDARIRILHMSGNTGNYAARNVGVQSAVGEFVTVHDDDDWSHPRKLEAQARALVETPETLANMSQLVRATDSLRFTRINGNPDFIQPNYSSLMFRREPVLGAIGHWNEVNRDADAEFRHRLSAWSGAPPTTVGAAPMSFLRVRDGSLTSGEIQRGYIDPRRRWYQLSTGGWREEALTTGESLYLAPGDPATRFSIPASMHGSGRGARLTADVVYATDFRFPGGNTSLSVNEISTLLEHGHHVAIMQMDSPVLGSTKHLTDAIRHLSVHPNCSVVTLLDEVSCDLLVVRHPTVLHFADRRRSRVSARRSVLIVNHPPVLRDGSAAHYDLPVCIDNFRVIFGQDPLVAPESGVIRDCLRGLVDDSLTTSFNWNGMISVPRRSPRSAEPTRLPVIGRHSRDNIEKWPAHPADLEAAYPIDGSRDVRILGGADIPLRLLSDRTVNGWTIHPFGSMPARTFLNQVDYWVYFHAEEWIESFGMATAEAMASGAVVVLPPYMEATFGPGAIYCQPDEVQALVDDTWSGSSSYQEQSGRGIEVATTVFTVNNFLQRIATLRQN